MQFPGMKALREIFVNIPQSIPHGDESLFQHCAVLNREILKKLLDSFFLLIVEEGIIIHDIFQVLQISEQVIGVHHIFISIIKITDKHLPPKIEIIQSFFALSFVKEYFIEFAYQLDRIAHFPCRKATEKFTNTHISR